uniref:Serpentine receptor class gamma n=1 Tax=Panagrolaimus sp. JU765 TaxID=591449 RepID=A0AC34QUW3_9BILA
MFMIVLIVNLVTPLAAIRTIRKAEECDYSEVDLSKTNNVAYDDYYNIYDYYLCFFSSASGLMLTINRMTAVLMPFKHNKIWDAKNTIIASLFMLLLPIPSAVFGQIMVRKELQTLITFITAIISFICIVLSLLLSFGLYFRVICTIQRIKESAKVQMKYERRLLAVIMFSNIGGFLYLLARYGAFIIDHIEPHDKYFEDFLHNMGSVLYIIFHYGLVFT